MNVFTAFFLLMTTITLTLTDEEQEALWLAITDYEAESSDDEDFDRSAVQSLIDKVYRTQNSNPHHRRKFRAQ